MFLKVFWLTLFPDRLFKLLQLQLQPQLNELVRKKCKILKNLSSLTRKFVRFQYFKNKSAYRKTCIFASLFLPTIINIFIQVIFQNIMKYLDKTFKEEQNDINFKIK